MTQNAVMRKRFPNSPALQRVYESMMTLAADPGSELYWNGRQHSGAGHRAAFWDGYNGLGRTAHVIPGTPSMACYWAGKDFRADQGRRGMPPVPHIDMRAPTRRGK